MGLEKCDMLGLVTNWIQKWNNKDLDGVMELFHDDIVFDNWTSIRVSGKESLRQMLNLWFSDDREFTFNIEDIFYDDANQKISLQWLLTWPSIYNGFKGQSEKRRGVDILNFKDGRIYHKTTYSKTTIEINGRKKTLKP